MAPRINLFGASRTLAQRSRPSIATRQPGLIQISSKRGFADGKDPQPATGPNQDVLGHVSEEAADVGKVTGETTPDLGQGTPVQEILQRDEESKENAPEIIKEENNIRNSAEATSFESLLELGQKNVAARRSAPAAQPYKYDLPELPLPSTSHLKHRYDPVVSQVTNLLMQHGKLSVAQRNMAFILNHLRTAPPPVPNPARPLLPSCPPPSYLPLNPVQYLTVAIDSVAPLLRLRSQKGAAGGGMALQIPVPLGVRQRRRQAVQWILDVVNKKESRGSGRNQFAQRFADELINVVEGKSSVWEKRLLVHKTGTAARVNLNYKPYRRK